MGLWSDKIKASRGESTGSNPLEKTPKVKKPEIDWEERHFQICLALIGRTDLNSYSSRGIIDRADNMVTALKKHYAATTEE